MEQIKLNHWGAYNNQLEISLLRFYVRIVPYVEEDDIKCNLKVYHNGLNKLELKFSTLEESMGFTEKVISECEYIDEINEKYKELYGKNGQKIYSRGQKNKKMEYNDRR